MPRFLCGLLLCTTVALADDAATYRIEVSQQPLSAIVAPLAEQSGLAIQVAAALATETITLTTGALPLPRLLAILAANVGGRLVTLPAGGYRLAPRRDGEYAVIPVKYMTPSQIAALLGWPTVSATGQLAQTGAVPYVKVDLGDTVHRTDRIIRQSTGTRYRIETPDMRRNLLQANPTGERSASIGPVGMPGRIRLELVLAALSVAENAALGLPAVGSGATAPATFGTAEAFPGDWHSQTEQLRRAAVGQRLCAVSVTAVQSLPVNLELPCQMRPDDTASSVDLAVVARPTGDEAQRSVTLVLSGGLTGRVEFVDPEPEAEGGQPPRTVVLRQQAQSLFRVPAGASVLLRWAAADEARPYRVLILTPTIASLPVLPQP